MAAVTRSLPTGYKRTSLAVLIKSRMSSGISAVSEAERTTSSRVAWAPPALGSIRV